MFSRAILVASATATTLFLPLALDRNAVGQFFIAQLSIGSLATFGQLGFIFTIPAQITEATAKGDFGPARSLVYNIAALCAVLSSLGTVSDVADYGLALRISTVLLIPLGILNAAFAPLAVQARTTERVELLRRMIARTAVVSGGLAAVGYIVFALVGYPVILNWKADFIDAYWLALILGAAKVLHACGGSAGVILMTWGDQSLALRLTIVSGLVTLCGCMVGYRFCGMYGLAAAAAAGETPQIALFVAGVKSRFGIDPSLLEHCYDWRRARPGSEPISLGRTAMLFVRTV